MIKITPAVEAPASFLASLQQAAKFELVMHPSTKILQKISKRIVDKRLSQKANRNKNTLRCSTVINPKIPSSRQLETNAVSSIVNLQSVPVSSQTPVEIVDLSKKSKVKYVSRLLRKKTIVEIHNDFNLLYAKNVVFKKHEEQQIYRDHKKISKLVDQSKERAKI